MAILKLKCHQCNNIVAKLVKANDLCAEIMCSDCEKFLEYKIYLKVQKQKEMARYK